MTPPLRQPGFSFCIITNGKRPEKLGRLLDSIRALAIPEVEILLAGEPPEGFAEADVTVVPREDAARNGRLGEMRNAMTRIARHDHLVVTDDDMIFHPDFHTGLQQFGDDWDVLCCRLLNPDGTRYWDWTTHGGPRGHILLEYDEYDPYLYITGGLCIMKAHVADQVQWDDHRGFYQMEDVDFSHRLTAAGFRVRFNRFSTVTHDDPRHHQVGQIVRMGPRALPQALIDAHLAFQGFLPREATGDLRWMTRKGEIIVDPELMEGETAMRFNLTCSQAEHYPSFPLRVAVLLDGQPAGALEFPAGQHTVGIDFRLSPSRRPFTLGLLSECGFPIRPGGQGEAVEVSVLLSSFHLEPV